MKQVKLYVLSWPSETEKESGPQRVRLLFKQF